MKRPPLFSEYLRYALPGVAGMLALSCYILADTFFVARALGPDGLAALNLAIPVYSLIHGTGLMIGIGILLMSCNNILQDFAAAFSKDKTSAAVND